MLSRPLHPAHAVLLEDNLGGLVIAIERGRATYDNIRRALPYLGGYYAGIRAVSKVPFDPVQAAWLELDWWIVHREAGEHPPGDLERALAALAAELYQVPSERLAVHAARRAEAMTIRDRTARRTVGVLDDDWDRIEASLWVAWRSLADEVRTAPAQEA